MVGIRRRSLAIATPLNLHYKKKRKNRLYTQLIILSTKLFEINNIKKEKETAT
jgi:hypothetical protein